MYDNSNIGLKPGLGDLPTKSLRIHPSYQRTIDTRKSVEVITKIVENFNWAKFGVLEVVPDGEGGWWVIDGQHRLEAARKRGIASVPCLIFVECSVEEQAQIFLAKNVVRVQMNNYAIFHARVAGGDQIAIATNILCKEAGFTIPKYPIPTSSLKPGQTLAVKTLEGVIRSGSMVERQAIIYLGEAYSKKIAGGSAVIMRATLDACKKIHSSKQRKLVEWFSRHIPETLNNQYVGSGGAALLADRIAKDVARESSSATKVVSSFIAPPSIADRMRSR
jgi:hypothetical protein